MFIVSKDFWRRGGAVPYSTFSVAPKLSACRYLVHVSIVYSVHTMRVPCTVPGTEPVLNWRRCGCKCTVPCTVASEWCSMRSSGIYCARNTQIVSIARSLARGPHVTSHSVCKYVDYETPSFHSIILQILSVTGFMSHSKNFPSTAISHCLIHNEHYIALTVLSRQSGRSR